MNENEGSIQIPWPYKLRRSLKARYLRINLEPGHPIEVVYPRWSNRREALGFLQQQITWVSKQTRYIESLANVNAVTLPETIYFPCLNRRWQVSQLKDRFRQRAVCREEGDRIILIGPEASSESQMAGVLRRWMKGVAVNQLQPHFIRLVNQFNFEYDRVQWRCQKTRWGSCSERRSISLNIKLLFLSQQQVEYVMLHELCHTRHLDHGQAFWQWLEQVCPGARMQDRELGLFDFNAVSWL